jgi:hypothetical protein
MIFSSYLVKELDKEIKKKEVVLFLWLIVIFTFLMFLKTENQGLASFIQSIHTGLIISILSYFFLSFYPRTYKKYKTFIPLCKCLNSIIHYFEDLEEKVIDHFCKNQNISREIYERTYPTLSAAGILNHLGDAFVPTVAGLKILMNSELKNGEVINQVHGTIVDFLRSRTQGFNNLFDKLKVMSEYCSEFYETPEIHYSFNNLHFDFEYMYGITKSHKGPPTLGGLLLGRCENEVDKLKLIRDNMKKNNEFVVSFDSLIDFH